MTAQIKREDLDAPDSGRGAQGRPAHHVQILETQTTLTPFDARSLAVDVHVKAKKLFITANLKLHGKVSIDDTLAPRSKTWPAMAKAFWVNWPAGSFARRFKSSMAGSFPWLPFRWATCAARSALQVGDAVRVTAAFGS